MFSFNDNETTMLEIMVCGYSEKKGMQLFIDRGQEISRRSYYRLKINLESSSPKILRKIAETLPFEHVKITFLFEYFHVLLMESIGKLSDKDISVDDLKKENIRNQSLTRTIKTLAEIQPHRTALREASIHAVEMCSQIETVLQGKALNRNSDFSTIFSENTMNLFNSIEAKDE